MKKNFDLKLIEVDSLCLGAITKVIRCDDDLMHYGNCSHKHTEPLLCNWMESFGEELEKQHQKMGNLEVVPTANVTEPPDGGWLV